MGFFNRIFGGNSTPPKAADQAVLVHLNGTDLADEVYQQYDLAGIEDQLIQAIAAANVGEFDGNEIGPTGATLFMYGPDAERLFKVVEPVLRSYPLCQRGRVVIRHGGPGAVARELQL
jgi:hypothetical protein